MYKSFINSVYYVKICYIGKSGRHGVNAGFIKIWKEFIANKLAISNKDSHRLKSKCRRRKIN